MQYTFRLFVLFLFMSLTSCASTQPPVEPPNYPGPGSRLCWAEAPRAVLPM